MTEREEETDGVSDSRELVRIGDYSEALTGGGGDVIVIYAEPVIREKAITEDLVKAILSCVPGSGIAFILTH